jgi:cyclic beta-1,2-glucan synthetase
MSRLTPECHRPRRLRSAQARIFQRPRRLRGRRREYVTILGEGQWTPAPWINVIANPDFGFQVSVEGSGYTWSINSQQNQITPWSNDPVSDRPGEVFYVRDEDSGELWGPRRCRFAKRPRPMSLGMVRATAVSSILRTDLARASAIRAARRPDQNLPAEDPQSFAAIPKISITAYVEWVLGTSRASSAPFVATAIDPETGAMLAGTIGAPSWRSRRFRRPRRTPGRLDR